MLATRCYRPPPSARSARRRRQLLVLGDATIHHLTLATDAVTRPAPFRRLSHAQGGEQAALFGEIADAVAVLCNSAEGGPVEVAGWATSALLGLTGGAPTAPATL